MGGQGGGSLREGWGGGGQQSPPCAQRPQLARVHLQDRVPRRPDTNLGTCLLPRCPSQSAVSESRCLSKMSRVTKTGVSFSAAGIERTQNTGARLSGGLEGWAAGSPWRGPWRGDPRRAGVGLALVQMPVRLPSFVKRLYT